MTTPPHDPTGDDTVDRRVRDLLAAPPPPSGALDDARAAAMGAFDEAHGGAAVHSITEARFSEARSWYQRVPLSAAAAVVAVVAVVGVLTTVDFGGDDEVAGNMTSADDAGDAGVGAATLGGGAPAAPEDFDAQASRAGDGAGEADDVVSDEALLEAAPSAGSSTAIRSYPDIDSLADDVSSRYDPDSGAGSSSAEPVPATGGAGDDADRSQCDAFAAAGVDPQTVVGRERATVGSEDRPVIVIVYDTDERRLAVVDEGDCEVVDDRAL